MLGILIDNSFNNYYNEDTLYYRGATTNIKEIIGLNKFLHNIKQTIDYISLMILDNYK